jgi:5-methylthioadenosine/S-adenosylhomocysteine deaminase
VMYAASSLGFWDAVKGGVTTVCDHYHFADATARAARRIGCRAVIADKIIEFTLDNPPRYDHSTQTYDIDYSRKEAEKRLAANVEFIEQWRGDSLVVPALGPHAADTLTTEMLQECARTAESLDVKMIMHVAQSAAEVAQVRRKKVSTARCIISTRSGFFRPDSKAHIWSSSTTRRSRSPAPVE